MSGQPNRFYRERSVLRDKTRIVVQEILSESVEAMDVRDILDDDQLSDEDVEFLVRTANNVLAVLHDLVPRLRVSSQ